MHPLELRNVSKRYGAVAAVEDVSFALERGTFTALVGRSGCGKSTLLNLCGAMDFPTSGSVLIDGLDTSGLADEELTRIRREKVGFVFQSFQLLHTLTAIENVELPLLLARRANARRSAAERLAWTGLEGLAHRYPHQLSGGEQQRVAIARALVANPPILLADEPTGNLDTTTGELVLDLLSRSAREFGCTVLMATHGAEATAAADQVIHMRDGRLSRVAELRPTQSTV
jgi:ABC-type lipoprotein export system ATPase subunit